MSIGLIIEPSDQNKEPIKTLKGPESFLGRIPETNGRIFMIQKPYENHLLIVTYWLGRFILRPQQCVLNKILTAIYIFQTTATRRAYIMFTNATRSDTYQCYTLCRQQMETFFAILALCAGNSPVTGVFSSQRPVTRSFDVFFDLPLNKRLSKQSWGWWFETPWRSLWRHWNDIKSWCS